MVLLIAANLIGAGVLYYDSREVDRDFWIALAVLTLVVWAGYFAGIHRGVWG